MCWVQQFRVRIIEHLGEKQTSQGAGARGTARESGLTLLGQTTYLETQSRSEAELPGEAVSEARQTEGLALYKQLLLRSGIERRRETQQLFVLAPSGNQSL